MTVEQEMTYEPDALTQLACEAIYRHFEGYWPNESERQRLVVALAAVTDPSAAIRTAMWHQTAETLGEVAIILAGHLPLFAGPPTTPEEKRKADRVEIHYQQYRAAMDALRNARNLDAE